MFRRIAVRSIFGVFELRAAAFQPTNLNRSELCIPLAIALPRRREKRRIARPREHMLREMSVSLRGREKEGAFALHVQEEEANCFS